MEHGLLHCLWTRLSQITKFFCLHSLHPSLQPKLSAGTRPAPLLTASPFAWGLACWNLSVRNQSPIIFSTNKLEFLFLDKLRYQTRVRHYTTWAKRRSYQKNERNKKLRVCVYTCKPRDDSKLQQWNCCWSKTQWSKPPSSCLRLFQQGPQHRLVDTLSCSVPVDTTLTWVAHGPCHSHYNMYTWAQQSSCKANILTKIFHYFIRYRKLPYGPILARGLAETQPHVSLTCGIYRAISMGQSIFNSWYHK